MAGGILGIRDTSKRNRTFAAAVTIALVLAAAFVLYRFLSGGSEQLPGGQQACFSDDDGKTFFRDDATKLPPFEHNGKQAVRAILDGGQEKVIYLERYTLAGKQLKTHPRPSSLDDPAASDPGLLNET